jgi:L-fuconate dehydratase
MSSFTGFTTHDVRFPTSRDLDGSDAMNPDPDYSAAYLVIGTDDADGLEGHGFAFTIGRGNDVQVAAIDALAGHLLGRDVEAVLADMGATSKSFVDDSQLRWLGPEKGVMHMAISAVVNALWDLKAKRAGLPLWDLLSRMSPEELVDLVDFRYLTDALTREEALGILRTAEPGRAARREELLRTGFPAYTTTPGWLGYSDEKLVRLAHEAVAEGFSQIKLKVGADVEDDERRLRLAREAVGPDVRIAVDANQRWDVGVAIDWINRLAPYDPWWIEEPTSPDDVLGHAAIRRGVSPVKVATGEHVQNRIVFKQLLQAGSLDVLQIDAARVGGVNENVAILLLAAKFGVPVCPHAGGVGLCELVQHLSMFDVVAVAGTTQDRVIEFVDHLHEHFLDPVVVEGGAYRAPSTPGFSAEVHPETLRHFAFPDGAEWRPVAAGEETVHLHTREVPA